MKSFSPDRRKFLKVSASAAGASLVLGINWSCSQEEETGEKVQHDTFSPNAWLRLDPQGTITVIVAESEMGQGPYTLMPMMVAEELEVDWRQVSVEHASLDPVYGYQMTGGSSSIRKGWGTLREAGAIAREILLAAGALSLSVPVAECTAKLGQVIHNPSGRNINYGALIEIASELPIPKTAYLKELDEFTIIGTPVPRLDTPEKLCGKARFGIDTKLPGMLYATITHCPVFGGKVKNIDASETKKIKGVKDVFQINEGVVVVASDTWTAFKGKDALKIDWDFGEKANLSSNSIIEDLKNRPISDQKIVMEEGEVEDILSISNSSISTEYTLPFQAHVPIEPMNCTAYFKDDKLEIWAPTQSPSAAYDTARSITQSRIERAFKKVQKKVFGTHDDSIDVHTTLLGGGFGRRLKQDYVSEVVQIAEHYENPVQLVWTRGEDIQHDYYHPLVIHQMRGALDEKGMPVAWEHIIRGGEVSAGGATRLPYDIPNTRVSVIDIGEVIPKGDWRSVAPHYNAYAIEHFFDELAHAGDHDPLDLRLKLMRNAPRLRNTLEIAADKAKWLARSHGTRHFGAAAVSGFGSHVAQIVELSEIGQQGLVISKVTCVIDCGIVINPDIVKAQMEGSIVFALTAAVKTRITINHGRVEQSNFHNYPILTMHETPEIEVIVVQNEEEPGGIGEPGVPPLAPALANAIFSATGKPVRELPVQLAV
jgi:isoquinoline 1-oxidoreductase beta subunit